MLYIYYYVEINFNHNSLCDFSSIDQVFKDENIYTCGFADEYTITQGNVLDTKSLYKNNYYIDTFGWHCIK